MRGNGNLGFNCLKVFRLLATQVGSKARFAPYRDVQSFFGRLPTVVYGVNVALAPQRESL